MNSDYTEKTVNTEEPAKTEETVTTEESVKMEEPVKAKESGKAAKPAKPQAPAKKSAPAKPARSAKTDNAVKKPLLSDAAKKSLKGMIIPLVITVALVLGVIFILTHKEAEEAEPVIRVNKYEGSMDPVTLENSDLKLTLYPATTYFELEVKSTGKIWKSNPVDDMSNKVDDPAKDSVAKGDDAKGRVNSTFVMSYTTDVGLEKYYDNYNYSVKNGVYDIEATTDYIKVSYSVGEVEKEYVIPTVTTEAKFDEWTSKMDKDARARVVQYYKKYDINKPGKKDDVEALKASYPIYETEPIYVIRDATKENMKSAMEGYFADAGYTMEDYKADQELNFAESSSDKAVFNISVYYRLDGKDLVVEYPFNEMQFDMDRPLYTLTPLPFFGAGGMQDEGALFVPEGGGAFIKFNNGKLSQGSYVSQVFGRDMALVKDAIVHDAVINYNTFGITTGNDSFLCIMEDGMSYANVLADIAGRTNSYNSVNAKYSMILREQYDLGGGANTSVYVFTPGLPQDESIVQRYRFIDSGDYVDMAKVYQNYLKQNFSQEFTMNSEKEAPVVIEMVAAVDKVKQVLGVPTSRPLKLTTFKEASKIMSTLQSEGMNNMSIKLTGWMNGGVNQKILKKTKLVKDCGSASDLKKFVQAASSLGINLYLDGVTQYAYDSDIFDGFNSFADAARFISRERAELYQYSTVTFAQREGAESHYLLHADLAKKMTDNLYKAVKKYGANISFRDTGDDLSGDYYKKKLTTREANRKSQMEQLAQISQDTKIMINGGNIYAAMYSDVITNMDLRGSEYTLVDEFFPFYEIAIHGYKDYVGEPINLTSDPTEELLVSAEYGAGLYFTIMAESPFALQKTLYTEYFGANFDSWHDKMVSIYNRYNRELGHVFNQEMTGHVTIEKGLTCTTYADGTKVYVNYNYLDKTADGKTIPARDYVVVR